MIAVMLAVFQLIHWIVQPGRCDALIAERNTGSGWTAANLYAGPGPALTIKLPRVAESDSAYADSGWVSLTQSGVATNLRCRCAGGPVSNVVAYVPAGSFARDTTLYAFGHDGEYQTARLGGGTRTVSWIGARGDSTAFRILTLDAEQQEFRADHCRAAGYGWLHGVRWACP